jgi:PAS domain S-box-containing protein
MAKRRILIVNEDRQAGGELEARLVGLGYEVVGVVSSGGEAVRIVATAEPELVLMSLTLRDDTGGGASPETAPRHPSVPVVFLGTHEDEARALGAGGGEPRSLLVAPFHDRELRVNVELALCRSDPARASHEVEGFFTVSIDMFCFLGFDGYFRRLNLAWERALGFTREELMSRPFIEFVHPDDRERTLKQNAQVKTGGQASGFENRYLCKDGSHRWLLWSAAPDAAEGMIYSVARDITAQKQAESERERLVRRLERSLAEVRTLREILPICSYCRKIRDDENYWQTVESYISRHTSSRFSHSICPACMASEVEPMLGEPLDE